MSANTQSLSTNFAVNPYYDDFDEAKNFHRILYRPGAAVQARELTQSQTILQNQIDRFAEHIFKEGSFVKGMEVNYDRFSEFVKLQDNGGGNIVDPSTFVGTTVTGQTSGVKGYVIDSLDGSESAAPNTKTLYIKYTSAGTDNVTKRFLPNEALVSDTALSANVLNGTQEDVTGTGIRVEVEEGIIFAKDHFIRVEKQSIIVSRYTALGSGQVGLTIKEEIISSSDDNTLLDPAQGAYNYNAPGADRLKLSAILEVRALDNIDEKNFIPHVTIKNGSIYTKVSTSSYSDINNYIARRTHDESGDYIVSGLNMRVREHLKTANNGGLYLSANGGDVNKLAIQVTPGKAYVDGFEVESIATRSVAVDKGSDFASVEAQTIPANYGNYLKVEEVVGTWDVNGHDKVDLYNQAQTVITSGTNSNNTLTGTKIGEARVRGIKHDAGVRGAPDCAYVLNLYDIKMSADTFSDVKSIYYNNTNSKGFADVILTGSDAKLSETSFNTSVYNLPANAIRTLRDTGGNIDTNFRFYKSFDVTLNSTGEFTLNTGSSDEQFPFTTGVLNDTQERDNFHLVINGSIETTALDLASRAQGGNTISGLTNGLTRYNVGDRVRLTGDANTFVVTTVNATDVTIGGAASSFGPALTGVDIVKVFEPGTTISMNGYGGDNAARSININSTISATFDIEEQLNSSAPATVICELNKIDGKEKAKVLHSDRYVQIQVDTNAASLSGPWDLGLSDVFKIKEVRFKTSNSLFTTLTEGTDVTDQFTLDTGQRDNLYEHGRIKLKTNATHSVSATNVYLIKLDYFVHDTSQGVGYFSVDSYPIDDANPSNTSAITTGEIPIFTSPVSGDKLNLRDSIDIRPRITDTANDTVSLTSISTNPASSTDIVLPSGGLHYIPANEALTADFDYYLGRNDRIVVTAEDQIRAIKGVPAINPKDPAVPSDGMTIGMVKISPYPSLPQENAEKINRSDLSIKVKPIRTRRYTMKDIGALDSRIGNLEYYTSLSLLEQDTNNLQIEDSSGLNRFKNGIIVDQFVDFSVIDFKDEDFKAAIDKTSKELRPQFKVDESMLTYSDVDSSGVTLRPRDARLVIDSSTATFTDGETITQGSNTAKLAYQVDQTLYLTNVVGSFDTSTNVVGSLSAVTSGVTSVTLPENGKLITLDYTHDSIIEQNFSTSTRNVTGLMYSFVGSIELDPSTDYWQDTVNTPSVQVDFGNTAEALQEMANAIGTDWGGWSTNTRSTSTTENNVRTTTTTTTDTRTGSALEVSTGAINETNLGDSVQEVSVIPYMRSRKIKFIARGIKPNTRMHAFFDSEDVNDYVMPTDSTHVSAGVEGDPLISDAVGNVYGIFRIPNDENLKFLNGSLKFRLSDSPTNSTSVGATTTSAEGSYTSNGLNVTKQGTIVSTRDVFVDTVTVTDTVSTTTTSRESIATPVVIPDLSGMNWGGGGSSNCGGDPIAQSFRTSDGLTTNIPGVFLTKLDLFFASKDATHGVIVEIREMDPSGQLITNNVVPMSRVFVPASDINISTNGSKVTPITFVTPIYLRNKTDYAFVVRSEDDNPNVSVFTAKLGEKDTITDQRVTKNPFIGIMYASANDRAYSMLQDEDIKFKMYFANFGTSNNGIATLQNEDLEFFKLQDLSSTYNIIGEPIHGETTLTMQSALTANVGDTVVGQTSTANGTVTYVSGSTVRVKNVTVDDKFDDSEVLTVYNSGVASGTFGTINSQSTPAGTLKFFDGKTSVSNYMHVSESTGDFVSNTDIKGQTTGTTATIESIDALNIDTVQIFSSMLDLEDTATSVTGKFALTNSSVESSFNNINLNETTEFDSRKLVLSKSTENTGLSGDKSGIVKFNMVNGVNKRHSPAIDIERGSIVSIENLINNNYTNEDQTEGGSADVKYITNTVTLAEGQDAEDFKVYITAYKPASADIKVYVKLLNNSDDVTISERPWVELDQVTLQSVISDAEDRTNFREFEYQIPDSYMTGASNEYQYVSNGATYTGFKRFKVKVVLLSSNPSKPPRIKDFRGIALQI